MSGNKMRIDPAVLYELRSARGLTREQLAKLAFVSPRQIQRLEKPKEASQTPREETVDRLARALRVSRDVLAGKEPLPVPNRSLPPFVPPSTRVTERLGFGTMLARDLVARRYNVNPSAIFNMAPLLFVLLAEGSLAWRRRELAALKEKLEDAFDAGRRSNRHRAALDASITLDHLGYEEEAIKRKDLMSDPYPFDYEHGPLDDSIKNPFAEYLHHLAEDLDVPASRSVVASSWGLSKTPHPRTASARTSLG